MNIQYISDNTGKTAGVFIPIQEWELLKAKYKGIQSDELEEMTLQEIEEGIKTAVKEMNLIKQGKLKARNAKDLLNEL